jgi:hypothetical protein
LAVPRSIPISLDKEKRLKKRTPSLPPNYK